MEGSKDIPPGQEDHYITKSDDWRLRREAVENNPHIVLEFFNKRVDGLFNKVLEPCLGVKEKIIRHKWQDR